MGKKKQKVRWTSVEGGFFEDGEANGTVMYTNGNVSDSADDSPVREHPIPMKPYPPRRQWNGAPVAPRFERKAQLDAWNAQFGTYELPNGFTKIRSKNLDVLFKKEYYAQKINPSHSASSSVLGEEDDREDSCKPEAVPTEEPINEEDEVVNGQVNDNQEVAEAAGDEEEKDDDSRDEMSPPAATTINGDATPFYPANHPAQQFQYPPSFVPGAPRPNLYLYSPSNNTMIPCEEIIIPNPVMGPDGPVYPGPSNIYLAFPSSDGSGGQFLPSPPPHFVPQHMIAYDAHYNSNGSVPYNSYHPPMAMPPVQYSRENSNMYQSDTCTDPSSAESTTPHSPPDLSVYSPANWADHTMHSVQPDSYQQLTPSFPKPINMSHVVESSTVPSSANDSMAEEEHKEDVIKRHIPGLPPELSRNPGQNKKLQKKKRKKKGATSQGSTALNNELRRYSSSEEMNRTQASSDAEPEQSVEAPAVPAPEEEVQKEEIVQKEEVVLKEEVQPEEQRLEENASEEPVTEEVIAPTESHEQEIPAEVAQAEDEKEVCVPQVETTSSPLQAETTTTDEAVNKTECDSPTITTTTSTPTTTETPEEKDNTASEEKPEKEEAAKEGANNEECNTDSPTSAPVAQQPTPRGVPEQTSSPKRNNRKKNKRQQSKEDEPKQQQQATQQPNNNQQHRKLYSAVCKVEEEVSAAVVVEKQPEEEPAVVATPPAAPSAPAAPTLPQDQWEMIPAELQKPEGEWETNRKRSKRNRNKPHTPRKMSSVDEDEVVVEEVIKKLEAKEEMPAPKEEPAPPPKTEEPVIEEEVVPSTPEEETSRRSTLKKRKKRSGNESGGSSDKSVRPVLIQDGVIEIAGHRRVKRAAEVLDGSHIDHAVRNGHLDTLFISDVGFGMKYGPLTAGGRLGQGKYSPPDRSNEIQPIINAQEQMKSSDASQEDAKKSEEAKTEDLALD